MWAHAAWRGRFLPADLRREEQLAAYGSWCTAVEGNTTAYGLPSPATVAAWAEGAPSDLRFLFKLPQAITHQGRLRDDGSGVAAPVAEVRNRVGAGRLPRNVLGDVLQDAGHVAASERLEDRLDDSLVLFRAHPSPFRAHPSAFFFDACAAFGAGAFFSLNSS